MSSLVIALAQGGGRRIHLTEPKAHMDMVPFKLSIWMLANY